MKYYMGIDLGTSSVKTLIMQEDGAVTDIAQEGYDIQKPFSKYAQQDMEQLWQAAKKTICTVLMRHPECRNQIAGIGYSGQMHGLVMLDKSGRLLGDAIIWADQRSAETIQDIYRQIPEAEYKEVTLNALSTGFLASSLMWVKEKEPARYEAIDKIMLPKDYIRYRMCGEIGTDMSDASSTVLFDTKNRQWAWGFIERLGLDKGFFVPCHEAYELAGEVTGSCQTETGLNEGTKIVYGGGDSLIQAVGNGIISPGILCANIGTASQLSCALDKPLYDKAFRTNTFCHVHEKRWMLMGANLSGGIALKWLLENMLDMKSVEEATALAQTARAGSQGLLFLPYLSGERTPYNDPDAKGIYFGLTLKHTRAELIRSTMEGIVFALRNSLDIFRDIGVEIDSVLASGGGARGALFRQIQADMFGTEIRTSVVSEQACVGACITAAVGTGDYRTYEEACGRIIRFSDEVTEPDAEHGKIYNERYQIYKELYPANNKLFGNF